MALDGNGDEIRWQEGRLYDAFTLCGDWGWMEQGYMAVLAGATGKTEGKSRWETVTISAGFETCRLWRLQVSRPSPQDALGLKNIFRYVHWDTPMLLVKSSELEI